MKNFFSYGYAARRVPAFILFVSVCAGLWAGPRETARELERKGSYPAAVSAYEEWLKSNTSSPDWASILLHAADIHPEVRAAIALLEKYAPFAPDAAVKRNIFAKTAALCEISGEIAKAQKLFEDAYAAAPSEAAMPHLYASARLLFELGELDRSEKFLRIVSGYGKDLVLKKKAAFLHARIFAARGNGVQALGSAEELTSSAYSPDDNEAILLFVYSLAHSLNRQEEKERALARLGREYPDSPELRLALLTPGVPASVMPLPTASSLLNPFGLAEESPALAGTPPASAGKEAAPPGREAASPPPEALATVAARTETPPGQGGLVSPTQTADSTTLGIQTGSFSLRENADYMVQDLTRLGFPAVVKEERGRTGALIYKVVVPVAAASSEQEEVQKLLIQLKEKGVEGFLLF